MATIKLNPRQSMARGIQQRLDQVVEKRPVPRADEYLNRHPRMKIVLGYGPRASLALSRGGSVIGLLCGLIE